MKKITKLTKQMIENFLREVHPAFKADVWGRVELEGDLNEEWHTSDILVAGYEDQERLTFLVTTSSNDRNIVGIDQAKRCWREPQYSFI